MNYFSTRKENEKRMELEVHEKENSKKTMKVIGTYINQDIYQMLQNKSQ